MTEVIPGLWIGNINDAQNQDLLNGRIRTVLNVSALLIENKVPGIAYFDIPIKNRYSLNVHKDIFEVSNAIIQRYIGGGIMINCKKGYHRSASVICAYLMYKYKFKYDKVIEFLKKKRPAVFSSSDYMLNELIKYSYSLSS